MALPSCRSSSFVLVALMAVGCGDAGSISSTSPPAPRADGQPPAPRAPDATPRADAGTAATDGAAATPDSAPPSGCPSAALVAGAYSGSYTGTLNGTVPLTLSGPMSFTLVPSGSDVVIQSGQVTGSLLGFAYKLPMGGKVSCGALDGSGSGEIAGMQFSGKFTATWASGAFSGGVWSGQDAKNAAKGSGSWSATKK
jgi:hypothetical protein